MTDDTLPPLVSVCIPTYNRADRLARAISAIQVSTYSNLEIIISDNASPDHTEETCRALATADSRIRYHRHPVNLGPTHNFNFAKSCATGKYFLWNSDDDYLEPDYIGACVARLEQDDGLILVAGLAAYHFSGDEYRYGNAIQLDSSRPLCRVVRYLTEVADNSIFYGVYRREALNDLAVHNELAGDWVWVASVVCRGRAEVLPKVHIYRDHGDTTSKSFERICAVLGLPKHQVRWRKYYIFRSLVFRTVVGSRGSGAAGALSRGMFRGAIAATVAWKYLSMKVPRLLAFCAVH